MNRTFGLRTTPGYIVSAVIAALAGGLIASYFGSSIYGTVGVAVILALVVMLTWRGSTAPEWVRRRRHVSSRLVPVSVATRDRAAVTWDREREEATVWLEIAPATPFSITEVDADGNVGREPVDLASLERMMVQGDIVLSRISLVTLGQRMVVSTDAAETVSQIIGQTPTHTGGRTFIVVSLRLTEAHAAINSRSLRGSFVVGVHKTVLAAAARIRIMVEGQGMRARVLNSEQIEQVSNEVLAQTATAADAPSWDRLGDKGGEVVSFTPSTAAGWVEEQRQQWTSVPARRVYEALSLEHASSGRVEGKYQVSHVAQSRSGVTGISRSMGLQRIGGQQVQALSRYVPHAADYEVDVPTRPLEGRDGLPLRVWPGGLGMLVGTTRNRGQLFMRIDGGLGGALYIVGSELLAQQMIMRLSLSQASVDVRTTTGRQDRTERWSKFVSNLSSPLVTFNRQPTADVVVVDEGGERDFADTDQTVIVVSAQPPVTPPAASIVAHTGDRLLITSGNRKYEVAWTMTAQERGFFTSD